jgi:hypothetical protein
MIYVLTLVLFIGSDLADVKVLPFDNLKACELATLQFQVRAKTDKDIGLWTSKCEAVPIPKKPPPGPRGR